MADTASFSATAYETGLPPESTVTVPFAAGCGPESTGRKISEDVVLGDAIGASVAPDETVLSGVLVALVALTDVDADAALVGAVAVQADAESRIPTSAVSPNIRFIYFPLLTITSNDI